MEKKKLGILTVARSEYGLLENLIDLAFKDEDLDTSLYVCGTHLSPEHGTTVKKIKYPTIQVETLLSSDTSRAMAKSLGIATISFADTFSIHRPDLLVILGDRYEHLAAAQAAYGMNIPIAHIGGGETTEGSLDDAFRHAITHMADLHFVYAESYACRVEQLKGLGYAPKKVHNMGFIGLDGLDKFKRQKLTKSDLIVCIWHPETVKERIWQYSDINTLLAMLADRQERLVLVKSGADAGSRAINDRLKWFQIAHSERVQILESIPRENFLHILSTARVIVGNSSAGIYEAPALGVPTINIGNRQGGRLLADSIICCKCTSSGIEAAFNKLGGINFKHIMLHREYALLGQSIVKALTSSELDLEIWGVDMTEESAGLYMCDRSRILPNLKGLICPPPEWVKFIGENGIKAIIPGSDHDLIPLATVRDEWEKRYSCNVLVSDLGLILIAQDKELTRYVLDAFGVSTPRPIWKRMDHNDPFIVKPRDGSASRGMQVCPPDSPIFYTDPTYGPLCHQEYLNGDEYTCSVFFGKSGPVSTFIARRELNNGVTYKAEIVDDYDIKTMLYSIAYALKPRGPINVQLRMHNEKPTVFELNARCSGTTAIRAAHGYNEPEMMIKEFVFGEELHNLKVKRSGWVFRYWDEIYVDHLGTDIRGTVKK
jgi:UDP-hydrolysing UDP-N-acetyl-D-glucosamine 2-epimerase